MKALPAALFVLTLVASAPLAAAESGWNDIAPGARLRALSAGAEIDGRALIGIELELSPGLKTYWRVPGETGQLTTVEVSAAGVPVGAEPMWPLPERDLSDGFVDFIYRDTLVLPVLIEAPANVALSLDVRMGICSDICVPVLAHLALPGDAKADAANSVRLRQALAETPIAFADSAPPLTSIVLDPRSGDLTLAFDPQRIDPSRLFPSFDGSSAVFGAPEAVAGENRLGFALLVRKGDTSWQGKPLRLTFATPDGPYDIVLTQLTR